MPTDRPRNFNDVMPSGGFSGMFTVTWLPTELKVAYWIWLIGGLLGLLGGVVGLFGAFVLLAVVPGLGFLVLLLVLVALALAAAQIILAMKMKEGREWARFALTIVAGISLLLAILNASAADGRGGGSWPSFTHQPGGDRADVAAQLAGMVRLAAGPRLNRVPTAVSQLSRRPPALAEPALPRPSRRAARIPLRNDPHGAGPRYGGRKPCWGQGRKLFPVSESDRHAKERP